jgi:hypothetical protein
MSGTLALLVLSAAMAAQPATPVTLRTEAQGYTFKLQVTKPDSALAKGPATPAQAAAMLPPGGPGRGAGNPPPTTQARGGGGGQTQEELGPVTLLEIGPSTHAMRLTVAGGPKGKEAVRARIVAVEAGTYDVAVAPMRRMTRIGEFGSNVALPGAGPYKIVARIMTRDGVPITAKFDYRP